MPNKFTEFYTKLATKEKLKFKAEMLKRLEIAESTFNKKYRNDGASYLKDIEKKEIILIIEEQFPELETEIIFN